MQPKILCDPIQIGDMRIKNRMVMPAMAIMDAVNGGFISEQTKFHFEKRAKGGVGLIFVGACTVDYRESRLFDEQISIDHDKFIPGLREVVEIIHNNKAKAAVQLQHGGNVVKSTVTQLQPVAPSAVARPGYEQPRELTQKEIAEIIVKFTEAAERARKAGFDAIELSACHRYLIQNFLSSAWNKRTDKYGGTIENRTRFLLEIIRAVKETVGQDFPLLVRLNGREYSVDEGTTIDESQRVAKLLQDAGVHALNISAFPAQYPYPITPVSPTLPLFHPGCYAHLAENVKKVVQIPVVAVGRISPELGEKLLRNKKADLIAFGRGLIADPELPNKVLTGRLDDIRRCLGCQECYNPSNWGERCTVNAAAFKKEREYIISPAKKIKNVFVIGGGPAGMEAARVAALRGHKVFLYEQADKLGGQQLLLSTLLREEYSDLTKYYTSQLKNLNIRVELNKKGTPALIEEIKPDAVITAAGPVLSTKQISGFNEKRVINIASIKKKKILWYIGSTFMSTKQGRSVLRWLLKFNIVFGKKVIIMGGGLAGSELADFLVERGKEVIIVTEEDDIAEGLGTMPVLRQYLLDKLAAKGVTMLSGMKYEKITKNGVVITNKDSQTRTIEADTLVSIGSAIQNTELYDAVKQNVPEVYIAGDSKKPQGMGEAISDGFQIGLKL